jgi:hypothetical protein
LKYNKYIETANSLDRELSQEIIRYDKLINESKCSSAKKPKNFKSSRTTISLPLIKELDELDEARKVLEFENEKGVIDSCSVMSTEISHIEKDYKIFEECKI